MYRFRNSNDPSSVSDARPNASPDVRPASAAFEDIGTGSCHPRGQTTHAFGDLFAFLEAEPAVDAFQVMPDGLVDVRYWGGRILVGTLPSSGLDRLRMEALKHEHQLRGRRVILVPEVRLQRRPFRENRRMIAAAAGTGLTPTERLRVLDAVDETGDAALGDLVRMLGTDHAAAGILALVSDGVLRIELAKPIDGNSSVRRFQAGC